MSFLCSVAGCLAAPIGALAIEIYPHEALMAYYRSNKPLSRMMTTLVVCRQHLPAKVSDMFQEDALREFYATIEATSGVTVDPTASRLVVVGLADPAYRDLVERQKGQ